MHIKVEFSEDSLFYRMCQEDIERYDVAASKARFAEHLENYIYADYPDADIEVVETIHERISVDGDTDNAEVPFIGRLVEKVFNDADWEVEV